MSIQPSDLGLPDKFHNGWREGQERIIQDSLNCNKRFIVQSVPTGGGKTVCYLSSALLHGGRTLILTSTKGLQDQIEMDFEGLVTVVKGQSAYKCKLNFNSCQYGPCHWGYQCALKDKGCHYYDNLREASRSHIVVTNYAFWLANASTVPIGVFDYIICDEAHDASEWVLSSQSIRISEKDVKRYSALIENVSSPNLVMEWVRSIKKLVEEKGKQIVMHGDLDSPEAIQVLNLNYKLDKAMKNVNHDWTIDRNTNHISFDPIWMGRDLVDSFLFQGAEKVLLTSATISKKDINLLGIAPIEYTFIEYPSWFPVVNRPITYISSVRMDSTVTNAGMSQWMSMIDNIIRTRGHRKGIVQAVSYDRSTRVLNSSQYSGQMITHDKKGVRDAVERFRRRSDPVILVSPSVITGWDFPYDQCRWQIIGKIPFPDSRSKVMAARQKIDPDYGCYMAMKKVVQAYGRGNRAKDDFCETFILDGHWEWFSQKYKSFMPVYFREALKSSRTIPELRR